jgi:hypothetical protein
MDTAIEIGLGDGLVLDVEVTEDGVEGECSDRRAYTNFVVWRPY